MKAHDLAKLLLAGPNVEIMVMHPDEPDYPLHINGIQNQNANFCECDEFDEDDEDCGEQVVTLEVDTTDGVLRV